MKSGCLPAISSYRARLAASGNSPSQTTSGSLAFLVARRPSPADRKSADGRADTHVRIQKSPLPGGRRLLQVRCLLARLARARLRAFLPLSARDDIHASYAPLWSQTRARDSRTRPGVSTLVSSIA